MKAAGSFSVKATRQPHVEGIGDPNIARMSLDKQFEGDLVGTSLGEMLAAGNPATGSAGYVAMEYVTATLNGRSGQFALQHRGSMRHGDVNLSVNVVPDSGSGELEGLEGQMSIKVEGPNHFYEFDYSLPESE